MYCHLWINLEPVTPPTLDTYQLLMLFVEGVNIFGNKFIRINNVLCYGARTIFFLILAHLYIKCE